MIYFILQIRIRLAMRFGQYISCFRMLGPSPKHSIIKLQCRHNGHDGVSNHQPHHCLLNRLYGRRSKKTSKLRVTGLCAGNSPGTGEFPAQMASNASNVCIWWRHHREPQTAHFLNLVVNNDNIEIYMIYFMWYNGGCLSRHVIIIYARALINTLRPRQNVRHFADDNFKCIFVNEND